MNSSTGNGVPARIIDQTYYDCFSQVEETARSIWEKQGVDRAPLGADPRPKRYVVGMFPYPSGNAHMGHVRVYTLSDCLARLSRFKGFAVLHPVGWDAFGLPAENAAIKHGIHPAVWVGKNIDRMQHEQLNRIGFSFDWSGQINSSSPEYYRWTQWLFLRLYREGYVQRRRALVNVCPTCQTVLANEQVIDGKCWRCSTVVERRELEQWFIQITRLAEELWRGLDSLKDWSVEATAIQRNWIGRSEGVEIDFPVQESSERLKIFTTRPDTIFGVTSITVAPEYPNLIEMTAPEQRQEVADYIAVAMRKSNLDRMSDQARTGVFSGRYCTNPLTGDVVPVYVSDYVIGSYGTGAIMNVPAHDPRDYSFAREYDLPVKVVILPPGSLQKSELQDAYTEPGTMHDSGQFSGMASQDAIPAIAQYIEERGFGRRTVNFKLHDWLISRQRYWGAPIPMIHCSKCGWLPVPDDQLPVLLPDEVDVTLSGRSPLAAVPSFVNTTCPNCGGPATREVDTMDTFMCSAWYVWRFTSPHDQEVAWRKEAAARWMPMDYYVGGLEHAAQHLIYFRFMSHFLHSIGLTPTGEPVDCFIDNGMVRFGGSKMSKSRGNVVVPTEVIEQHGADALRLAILADTPVQRDIDWTDQGLTGKQRFISSIWDLYRKLEPRLLKSVVERPDVRDSWERSLVALLYRTARNVERELEQQRGFHNAIAHLHSFVSAATRLLAEANSDSRYAVASFVLQGFLKILGVFAPHVCEILWQEVFGSEQSLYFQRWIEVDETLLLEDNVEVVFQINGKLRGSAVVPRSSSQEQVLKTALADPRLTQHMNGQEIRKVIFIPDRLLNIVI